MRNIFSNFCIIFFAFFSHHSSATLSKIKLKVKEPYPGPKIPWNYRGHLHNRYSGRGISAEGVSNRKSHPLKIMQNGNQIGF